MFLYPLPFFRAMFYCNFEQNFVNLIQKNKRFLNILLQIVLIISMKNSKCASVTSGMSEYLKEFGDVCSSLEEYFRIFEARKLSDHFLRHELE